MRNAHARIISVVSDIADCFSRQKIYIYNYVFRFYLNNNLKFERK